MTIKYKLFTLAALGAALLLIGSVFLGNVLGLISPEAAASSQLQTESSARTITVVGEGRLSVAPDIAIVNLGVQVVEPDVQAATTQASQAMESVLTTLKAEGIADKDIQTSYYSLYVDRPYGPEGPSDTARYQVSNTVQVTVRDLSKVTTILGAAIEAGANNINNVEFRLTDASAVRAEARKAAVADALATAEELAELNGVAIGPVVDISEVIDNGAYFVSEQSYAAATGFGGGGGGPLSPGNVDISVQLQISYALLQ